MSRIAVDGCHYCRKLLLEGGVGIGGKRTHVCWNKSEIRRENRISSTCCIYWSKTVFSGRPVLLKRICLPLFLEWCKFISISYFFIIVNFWYFFFFLELTFVFVHWCSEVPLCLLVHHHKDLWLKLLKRRHFFGHWILWRKKSEKSKSDCGSIVWRGRVTVNVYGALARPGVSLRSSTYLISVNVERTNKPKRGKNVVFFSWF